MWESRRAEKATASPQAPSVVRREEPATVDRSLLARITNVRRIIDFRNRLIHGYASVSPQVVWGIISSDVAILLEEVRALMKEP